jgi:hypothetical protein
MTDPLFDAEEYLPLREDQQCQGEKCPTLVWASDDQLRVLGWLVFDGLSVTGEPLHVRVCPACQRKEAKP